MKAPPSAGGVLRGATAPLRHVGAAFRFLTRLPVPGPPAAAADLARALAWFPLPGLVLGLILAGGSRLADGRLSPLVTGALLVAALAWLTGGLHLDGLADVADGLGGGRGDRERTLAIMRDSRIGALGATALAAVLGTKTAALAELLARGDAAWALVAAPCVARAAAVPLVVLFPYARKEGLGEPFHKDGGPREIAIAGALAVAVLATLGHRTLAPAAAALSAALAVAFGVRRRLGGLTGDVYGAAVELAELAFLVVAGIR